MKDQWVQPRVSGAEIRVAITGASPLVNPRLSEINWDDVARVLNAQREEVAARTPSQPDRHRHVPEYPSSCTGCEHLAADLASRLPVGLLPQRTPSQPDLREALDKAEARARYWEDQATQWSMRAMTDAALASQPAPAEYPGFAADVLRFVPRFTDDEHGMDPDAARRIRAYLETRVLRPAPCHPGGTP